MNDSFARDIGRIGRYLFDRPVTVACNLCGGRRARVLARIDRHALGIRTVICRRCGAIYTNPRPSDEALSRFYEADYRILTKEGGGEAEELHQAGLEEGRRLIGALAGVLPPSIGSVIEVGSAAGGILLAFGERYGAKVFGVEPTMRLAEYANAHGIPTQVGLFETAAIPSNTFDLAIMVRTVRHLSDPAGTFDRVRDALVPGGRFLVECTDVRKYVARHGLRAGFQVDHLYAFTPETLAALLRARGFEVVGDGLHPQDQTRFVLLAAPRGDRRTDSFPDARRVRQEILAAHRAVRPRLYRGPDYLREWLGDVAVNRMKRLLGGRC